MSGCVHCGPFNQLEYGGALDMLDSSIGPNAHRAPAVFLVARAHWRLPREVAVLIVDFLPPREDLEFVLAVRALIARHRRLWF